MVQIADLEKLFSRNYSFTIILKPTWTICSKMTCLMEILLCISSTTSSSYILIIHVEKKESQCSFLDSEKVLQFINLNWWKFLRESMRIFRTKKTIMFLMSSSHFCFFFFLLIFLIIVQIVFKNRKKDNNCSINDNCCADPFIQSFVRPFYFGTKIYLIELPYIC